VGKGIRGKERKRIGKREMGDEERRGREYNGRRGGNEEGEGI